MVSWNSLEIVVGAVLVEAKYINSRLVLFFTKIDTNLPVLFLQMPHW